MKRQSEDSAKTVGLMLKVIALPIMVINIILLGLPNRDLGICTILLFISTTMFFLGVTFSHLPPEKENEEEKEK